MCFATSLNIKYSWIRQCRRRNLRQPFNIIILCLKYVQSFCTWNVCILYVSKYIFYSISIVYGVNGAESKFSLNRWTFYEGAVIVREWVAIMTRALSVFLANYNEVPVSEENKRLLCVLYLIVLIHYYYACSWTQCEIASRNHYYYFKNKTYVTSLSTK